MMNLLIDFIPFQMMGGVGGAASFTKAVYDELFSHPMEDVRVFAAYDATLPTQGRYDCNQLSAEWKVTLEDISERPLSQVIRSESIDTFFIAIGQFYKSYDLKGISCRTIMFIHDIFDVERCDNRLDLTIVDRLHESRWHWMKRVVNLITGRWNRQMCQCYDNLMPLYAAPNTLAYTVSDYSRQALQYYFPEIKKDIRVCYSPLKNNQRQPDIENPQLAQLVNSGKPYLLMLAADRIYKNAALVTKTFLRLQTSYPDLHLLTLKYGQCVSDRHIDISYLSDSDLEHAYEHAHALVFASFFEGFGYPPIEAAHYGTPTVASNVTSIPEILGSAGIYFSPFYPADLYRALQQVLAHRDKYTEAISQRYHEMRDRQQRDLKALILEILNG